VVAFMRHQRPLVGESGTTNIARHDTFVHKDGGGDEGRGGHGGAVQVGVVVGGGHRGAVQIGGAVGAGRRERSGTSQYPHVRGRP